MHFVSLSVHRSVRWSVCCSVSRTVHRSLRRSVRRSVAISVRHSVHHSVHHTVRHCLSIHDASQGGQSLRQFTSANTPVVKVIQPHKWVYSHYPWDSRNMCIVQTPILRLINPTECSNREQLWSMNTPITSSFGQRCVWIGHFGTIRKIFWRVWSI